MHELEKEAQRLHQARKDTYKKYALISAKQNKQSGNLKFTIMPGNNSEVVRRVMRSRLMTTSIPESSIEN